MKRKPVFTPEEQAELEERRKLEVLRKDAVIGNYRTVTYSTPFEPYRCGTCGCMVLDVVDDLELHVAWHAL